MVSRRPACVPRLTAGAQFLGRPSQGGGACGPNVRLMNPQGIQLEGNRFGCRNLICQLSAVSLGD